MIPLAFLVAATVAAISAVGAYRCLRDVAAELLARAAARRQASALRALGFTP